jgi:hypothetical protein
MNTLEWNIKHNTLASLRPVFAAGEMNVAQLAGSTKVKWNLNSGSFSEIIILQSPDFNVSRQEMASRMTEVWNAVTEYYAVQNLTCLFTYVGPNGKLLNYETVVTYQNEILTLCNDKNSEFLPLNPMLCGCIQYPSPMCAAAFPGLPTK